MKRQVELRRRLRTLRTLREAVGAMKSLSAHHFRAARAVVEPARAYRRGVERVLAWSHAALPSGENGAGLLVIGGEYGLCGAFHSQLVAEAVKTRRELGAGPTLCVGRRGATLLARSGVAIDAALAAPTGVRGITDLLLRVGEDVFARYTGDRLSSFHIVSSRFVGVGHANPVVTRLLPVAFERAAPERTIRYVARALLATAAIREFLYVSLYQLVLDALASEHGARLVATQAAERWLDERTEVVRLELATARREASTQEMIEIAAASRLEQRKRAAARSVWLAPGAI